MRNLLSRLPHIRMLSEPSSFDMLNAPFLNLSSTQRF